MSTLYFKLGQQGEPVPLTFTSRGCAVGAHYGLEPAGVFLNDRGALVVGGSILIPPAELQEIFRAADPPLPDGATSLTAIIVTGRIQVPTVGAGNSTDPTAFSSNAAEQMVLLLPAVPATLPTTAQQIKAYFADTSGQQLPLSHAAYDGLASTGVQRLIKLVPSSPLTRRLDYLVCDSVHKKPDESEQSSSSLIANFLDTAFEAFDEYTLESPALDSVWTYNLTEPDDTAVRATIKQTRLDSYLNVKGHLLFVGEDKQKNLLHKAKADLTAKLVNLPMAHRGPVQYLLAYALSGYQLELYMVTFQGHETLLTKVAGGFNLDSVRGRILFLFALAKAYALLVRMYKSLPDVRGTFPHCTSMVRTLSTISFDTQRAFKVIKDLDAYFEPLNTDIENVKRGYALAHAAAASRGPQRPPFMVTGMVQVAEKRTKEGKLPVTITTMPLGYSRTPTKEQHLQGIAWAELSTAHTLHSNTSSSGTGSRSKTVPDPLVLRDPRAPNVVCDIQNRGWIAVDLDAMGKPGLWEGEHLEGWDAQTLNEAGWYDQKSDIRQIGLMLARYSVPNLSAQAQAFIHRLTSKQVTAEQALQDPWLAGAGDQNVEDDDNIM